MSSSKVPPKKTMVDGLVTIAQMKDIICRETNRHPQHLAFLPDSKVRSEYNSLLRARTELQALEKKRKEVVAQINKSTKELHTVEEKLERLHLKGPPIPLDPKEGAVKMIYSCVRKQGYVGVGHKSIGGTYAHLSRSSIEKLFHLMATVAEFDRSSVLIDVGSGLNVPCLHAATSYCKLAIGVEIDKMRVRESARLALAYFKTQCNEPRNHRVAVINADILKLLPVDCATHAYMFDLVFPDDVYEEVIMWLKRSTFRYVITFKPSHWTSYVPFILEQLGAEEVGRLSGLKMACSTCSATAIIFRCKERKERDMSECPAGLMDLNELATPFLQGSIDDTVQCYEALVEAMNVDLGDVETAEDTKKRTRSSKRIKE